MIFVDQIRDWLKAKLAPYYSIITSEAKNHIRIFYLLALYQNKFSACHQTYDVRVDRVKKLFFYIVNIIIIYK